MEAGWGTLVRCGSVRPICVQSMARYYWVNIGANCSSNHTASRLPAVGDAKMYNNMIAVLYAEVTPTGASDVCGQCGVGYVVRLSVIPEQSLGHSRC